MIDYDVGDVIEGRFSCTIDRPAKKLRVLVRGRVPEVKNSRAGFHGDVLDYEPHKGYGAWGYDGEIESVRPGTERDHEAAAEVRRRVEGDTARAMASR